MASPLPPNPLTEGHGVHHVTGPDSAPGRRGYSEGVPESATAKVLVYSDDRLIRQQVRMALGRRPAADLPAVDYTEVATAPGLEALVDENRYDLIILDGEATPAGGMGIARQLKDELYRCPPILLLIGRPQDAWLATWSRADAVVAHPIDAIAMARAAEKLLRPRVSA